MNKDIRLSLVAVGSAFALAIGAPTAGARGAGVPSVGVSVGPGLAATASPSPGKTSGAAPTSDANPGPASADSTNGAPTAQVQGGPMNTPEGPQITYVGTGVDLGGSASAAGSTFGPPPKPATVKRHSPALGSGE